MCTGALDLLMAEIQLTQRRFRQTLYRPMTLTPTIALGQLSAADKSSLLQLDLGCGTIFIKHMHTVEGTLPFLSRAALDSHTD